MNGLRSRSSGVLALAAFAALRSVAVHADPAAVPASKRAVWAEHNLTMELDHLPVRYSCSDLNHKVHDILVTMGARENLRVQASRCGPDLDWRQVAPWVHVSFSLPFEVGGQLAAWADMSATESTVLIEPGSPPAIDWRDCQLLRQLEVTLFAQIPVRVTGDRLGCHSNTTANTPFSVSLDVLMPAAEPARARVIQQRAMEPSS